MAQVSVDPWATTHEVLPDGTVAFSCSQDVALWPWLELDPHDPIVIQTINFWASYQSGQARGGWEPGQWTALTWMEWECGDRGCGHATHGIEDTFEIDGEMRFRLTFFDVAGRLVARMSGTGVVFRNRDFEGWRAKSKQQAAIETAPENFEFASSAEVGASVPCGSVLAPLEQSGIQSTRGLITPENGLAPANPHLSGSGDHVNATHLAEAVRQFDTLLQAGDRRIPTGGEMRFSRYVELGVPFDISLSATGAEQQVTHAEVHQGGRLCTTASFRFA
ncbi:hotdog family protein [Parerythrobacter jejuensis]|uniref:Uncharacterized protein n=1 Tax=Parerythrobacter jejuensis TaxID=795812 RepID=A0A845APA6_9SPHN|nr:hypothetical protein [Parerythrobacter jejuensis]MXP31279.1 hypothetical protein [Parerythrobacter jejuensis]MXP34039.1 hypothetical protein [Parerythrobacter jejuensis]